MPDPVERVAAHDQIAAAIVVEDGLPPQGIGHLLRQTGLVVLHLGDVAEFIGEADRKLVLVEHRLPAALAGADGSRAPLLALKLRDNAGCIGAAHAGVLGQQVVAHDTAVAGGHRGENEVAGIVLGGVRILVPRPRQPGETIDPAGRGHALQKAHRVVGVGGGVPGHVADANQVLAFVIAELQVTAIGHVDARAAAVVVVAEIDVATGRIADAGDAASRLVRVHQQGQPVAVAILDGGQKPQRIARPARLAVVIGHARGARAQREPHAPRGVGQLVVTAVRRLQDQAAGDGRQILAAGRQENLAVATSGDEADLAAETANQAFIRTAPVLAERPNLRGAVRHRLTRVTEAQTQRRRQRRHVEERAFEVQVERGGAHPVFGQGDLFRRAILGIKGGEGMIPGTAEAGTQPGWRLAGIAVAEINLSADRKKAPRSRRHRHQLGVIARRQPLLDRAPGLRRPDLAPGGDGDKQAIGKGATPRLLDVAAAAMPRRAHGLHPGAAVDRPEQTIRPVVDAEPTIVAVADPAQILGGIDLRPGGTGIGRA